MPVPKTQITPKLIVELWLTTDCETGNEGALDKMAKAKPRKVEKLLIKALDKGPDAAAKQRARVRAKEVFGARTNYAERNAKKLRGMGLDHTDTEQDFIGRQVRRFEVRYRTHAIAGLGVVGGKAAEKRLRKLVGEDDAVLKYAALQALERIGRDKKPDRPPR